MQIAVLFDPTDPTDIRRASDYLTGLAAAAGNAPDGLRQSIEEILSLASGELLRLAHAEFGTARFNLVALAQRSAREVASLHSLRANLGRACAQRGIEVFESHGGQPLELSIRTDVARVLTEIAA